VTSPALQQEPRIIRVATSITMNTIMRTQLAFLHNAGLSVACACDDDEWTAEIRALGVKVIPLGMGRRPSPLRGIIWGYRFYRLLARERPDLVHLHNAFHGIIGRPIARLARVPVVVQTVHNWWYLRPEGSLVARLYLLFERFAARFSDAVFFINHDDLRYAHKARIVDPRRTYFIGNGIDTHALGERLAAISREESRFELNLGPQELAITMIARLEYPKDHETLLRAFASLVGEVPRAKLLLAGQGLDEKRVHRLARSLGVTDSTRFMGHVSEVSKVLKASDILVLASHCEGFGRCLVEAMVARVPVVGSDVPGIREVISHEQTGLLVAPRDVGSLHAALRRLVFDPSLRNQLGGAGHEAALRDFDEARPAQRVLDIYRALIVAKGRQRPTRSGGLKSDRRQPIRHA
jgi:glycosyltransferase involved in cell wall biosynthesis